MNAFLIFDLRFLIGDRPERLSLARSYLRVHKAVGRFCGETPQRTRETRVLPRKRLRRRCPALNAILDAVQLKEKEMFQRKSLISHLTSHEKAVIYM
jgi:hypothetical protein